MNTIKCREKISTNTFTYRYSNQAGPSCSLPVLGITTILALLPAMIYGCNGPEPAYGTNELETDVSITNPFSKSIENAECIDILVFNDDALQRLDTYQRFGSGSRPVVKASSSVGEKIMTVIVNDQRDRYEWAGILSHQDMYGICGRLEYETSSNLLMVGEERIRAGKPVSIKVERLSSEIYLKSISCNFSGKSYEGKALTDVRIYLTNVNAEAPVLHDTPYLPTRIINHGKLEMADVERFKDPESILQELSYSIGSLVQEVGIRFRCYPNEAETEGPGSPFTRLVIEGKIDGATYYWPININRGDEGTGISRNCRYVYDVRITRLGHTDPDIPVETEEAEIIMEIEPWEELEEYGVRF
jgi:hypothetical protein